MGCTQTVWHRNSNTTEMLAAIILNSVHDVASYLAFICRVRIRVRVRVRFRSCPVYPLARYTVSSISTTCTAFTTNCKASTSAHCITTVTTSFSSPSSYFFYSSSVGLFSLRRSLLLIILLMSFLSQQLIISGAIETNPGPKHGGE